VGRSKHVAPSINFRIINCITKLHLVGISTESSKMHGSMNIKHMGIREKFNFPSFEGLDETKTTKVPKLHFYALLRYQAITSNDIGITLQCNVFF
jgi:hypothetical protein